MNILSKASLVMAFSAIAVVAPNSVSAANIVDTAKAAGSFNTLVAALEATGLDQTLEGDGPFTVFAPTDDAFAALPEGVVKKLVNKDTNTLAEILTYHVVGGENLAADVVGANSLTSVQGQALDITVGDGVQIENANIVTTDIITDNGVIHVIDAVMLPSGITVPPAAPTDLQVLNAPNDRVKISWNGVEGADRYQVRVVNHDSGETVVRKGFGSNKTMRVIRGLQPNTTYTVHVRARVNGEWSAYTNREAFTTKQANIYRTAKGAGSFTTLLTALDLTELDAVLKDRVGGPYTVFAPTDEAFAALPAGTLESLIANPDQLADILLYHVVPGEYSAADVTAQERTVVETAQGSDAVITFKNGKVKVDGVEVVATDIEATNGVIHVIDGVMLP